MKEETRETSGSILPEEDIRGDGENTEDVGSSSRSAEEVRLTSAPHPKDATDAKDAKDVTHLSVRTLSAPRWRWVKPSVVTEKGAHNPLTLPGRTLVRWGVLQLLLQCLDRRQLVWEAHVLLLWRLATM